MQPPDTTLLGEEQWAAVSERMGTRSEKSVETHWKVLTGQRTASGYSKPKPRAQPAAATRRIAAWGARGANAAAEASNASSSRMRATAGS